MELLHRFKTYRKETLGLPDTARLLLAVSGGLDSMVMARLALEAGIQHGIAHCNFGLRGPESDADEALVRGWASAHNLPFHTVCFDTAAEAVQRGCGIQETARMLRYDWFERIRKEAGYTHIATAHHADDSAETVLLNLFKGTGIAGLHGIRPRTGALVRPLLFATRAEIDAFAREAGVSYREDASNATADYARNALRHQVVPAIEAFAPAAMRQVAATAGRIAEAEVLYRRAIEGERKRLIERRGADWYLPIRKLVRSTPLDTLLFELFLPFGFTARATAGIAALLDAQTGRFLENATHRVIRHRDFLVVTALEEDAADFYAIETLPADLQAGGHRYRLRQTAGVPVFEAGAEYLDASRIEFPLILRKARAGDYFYPLGMGMKKKKVTRFLNDRKVSGADKARVWVLESAKRIVWVAGYRIDERFKVTERTTAAIRLERRPL